MTEFDPEKFEDKYEHYFPELQRAYRQAFETMNDAYDSELVHAIDQQILAESEPFYEGNAEQGPAEVSSEDGLQESGSPFRVELPEDPVDRLSGVVVPDEKAEAVLERYVSELEAEIADVFGVES